MGARMEKRVRRSQKGGVVQGPRTRVGAGHFYLLDGEDSLQARGGLFSPSSHPKRGGYIYRARDRGEGGITSKCVFDLIVLDQFTRLLIYLF